MGRWRRSPRVICVQQTTGLLYRYSDSYCTRIRSSGAYMVGLILRFEARNSPSDRNYWRSGLRVLSGKAPYLTPSKLLITVESLGS